MFVDEADWGPSTCFNDIQDTHEDGVDCCADGGDPMSPCTFACGTRDPLR